MNVLRHILAMLFLAALPTALSHGHGFCDGTLARMHDGTWMHVSTLASTKTKACIVNYDVARNIIGCGRVARGRHGTTNCFIRFSCDANAEDVRCALTQQFYTPLTQSWTEAGALCVGDCLLAIDGTWIPITHIEVVRKSADVYALEIAPAHTFYVGRHCVLTHNWAAAPAISLSGYLSASAAAMGCSALAATVVGVASGVGVFVLCGCAMKHALRAMQSKHDRRPTYTVTATPEDYIAMQAAAVVGSERVVQAIEEAADKEPEPERPRKRMVYEPIEYHPSISLLKIESCKERFINARKNPGLPFIEGQALLSLLSFPIDAKHRMAYFAGYFVEFRLDRETVDTLVYHCFYRFEDPGTLDPLRKRALANKGVINGKGRLIG